MYEHKEILKQWFSKEDIVTIRVHMAASFTQTTFAIIENKLTISLRANFIIYTYYI